LRPVRRIPRAYFGGGFALDQQSSRSHLIMQYYGSRILDYPDSVFDSSYHNLSFSQTITLGRWVVRPARRLDNFSAVEFWRLDIAGAPLPAFDAALTSVTPQLEPAQTIQTGAGQKDVDNTPLGEVDYSLSRRSTVTLTGSYGLLHFLAFRCFIDSNNPQGRVGYTYRLTPQGLRRDNLQLFSYAFCWHTPAALRVTWPSFFCALDSRTLGFFSCRPGPQLFQLENFWSSERRPMDLERHEQPDVPCPSHDYSLAYFREITSGSGVILAPRPMA